MWTQALRIYFKDVDKDGIVDMGDQVILLCGERKGGTSYFALDVTDPVAPRFMWQINRSVIAELGETWSEPVFGLVKTSDADDDTGTPVMFIGGGYSSTNLYGRAVLARSFQAIVSSELWRSISLGFCWVRVETSDP